MNMLDLIVTIVLIYNAVIGFRQGFIQMAIDLLALIVGIVIAIKTYLPISENLQGLFPINNTLSDIVSFVLIWGCVLLGMRWVGRRIQSITESFSLFWPLNRFGGAVIGGVRGILLMMPILIPISQSNLAIYHQSEIAKPLKKITEKRIIHTKEAQKLLQYLNDNNKKSLEKVTVLSDPIIQELQKGLQSDSPEDLNKVINKLQRNTWQN